MNDKIFFLPVNTGYFSDGLPSRECINFYGSRSSSYLYCSIVGNVATRSGFRTNDKTGIISKNYGWTELAVAIKRHGTIPGIQLSRTWSDYVGQKRFVTDSWSEYKKNLIEILKKIEIDEVYSDICESIDLACNHGFEHIQIHAAHGYLLSSMLDPQLYDQSSDVISMLKKICLNFRSKIELSIRISAYCGFEKSIEKDRYAVLKLLFDNYFDYIDLSEGYYNYNKNFIYPMTHEFKQKRVDRCLSIASDFRNQDYIVSGWIDCEQSVPSNVYKGFCRPIIANKNFVNELKSSCSLCGECHYFSSGKDQLLCGKW